MAPGTADAGLRGSSTRPADRPGSSHVVASFAIPRELPDALLEGFAWDVDGRRYQDLFELRAYAARVAGSVGAMMAVVMGYAIWNDWLRRSSWALLCNCRTSPATWARTPATGVSTSR